jgi:hypothetical protein
MFSSVKTALCTLSSDRALHRFTAQVLLSLSLLLLQCCIYSALSCKLILFERRLFALSNGMSESFDAACNKSALGAVAAAVWSEEQSAVKIKVAAGVILIWLCGWRCN